MLQLELSAQVRVANIKVIDAAERPRTPVTPNHQRDLMLALAGGLVGGLALAFVLELGDTTLRSAREVDLITQLPSVGTVPAIRGFTRRMLAPLDDLQSLVRENQLRPERIAGGWWDRHDVERDYFEVELPDGSRLWLFRDRTTDRFFRQGSFS